MKKIITLVILVFCLSLTACGKTDVGVIGGSDGPTEIIVSESNKEKPKTTDNGKYFICNVYWKGFVID